MRQREFEKEFAKRLSENRRLVERPFLPGVFFPLAALVAFHLFYVLLVGSVILALVTFGLFQEEVLRLSRVILWL